MKINLIKPNPNNPRIIKDDKFKKLVQSIKDFPQMLELRPIVIDENNIVLGGNMRLKACQELGIKDVPTIYAKDLTEDQKKEFIIKDNVGFGEWNWDDLANDWDETKLVEWGLDILSFDTQDFSDKNKEIDTDFEGQKYTFKLEYSEEEYYELKTIIESKGQTPEQIFYAALTTI